MKEQRILIQKQAIILNTKEIRSRCYMIVYKKLDKSTPHFMLWCGGKTMADYITMANPSTQNKDTAKSQMFHVVAYATVTIFLWLKIQTYLFLSFSPYLFFKTL